MERRYISGNIISNMGDGLIKIDNTGNEDIASYQ